MRGSRWSILLLAIGWATAIAGWAVALAHRYEEGPSAPAPAGAPSLQTKIPPVVAEVDGRKIGAEEFLGRLLRCYGRAVLDRLVRNALIERLAKREGVSVSEQEVERRLREKMEEASKSGLPWEAWLEAKNLSERDLREDLKYDLLLERVAERHTKVTEEEMLHYFRTYRHDLGGPDEVRVSHILVHKREEAERILRMAREGKNFGSLARKYSHDLATKDRGGDLGWFKRGVLAPELRPLEDLAFSLEPGQMGIVKTFFGWHVVKVTGRKRKRLPSYEEVRERVRREVFENKRRMVEMYLLDRERKRAKIKVFLQPWEKGGEKWQSER